MSIVIAKKYENKIEFASDSIVLWGDTKKTNGVKLFRISENCCIGFVGSYEQNILLLNIMSESELLTNSYNIRNLYSYISQSLSKLSKLMCINDNDNIDLDINMLVGIDNKLFSISIENNILFIESVKDYHCIGNASAYGFGAMAVGSSPEKAVEAVTNICLYTAPPILTETIYF